jgi:hypothetical protein
MFRRSGHRFADKNMRRKMILEGVPIPQERDVLRSALARPQGYRQRGNIPASSRPRSNSVRDVNPPCLSIHCRTDGG